MADSLDQEQRQPLHYEGSRTPEPATQNTTVRSPPQPAPARHRVGYARAPSVSFIDFKGNMEATDGDAILPAQQDTGASHGLGIDVGSSSPSKTPQLYTQTIRRTPVGSKRPSDQTTPDSGKPLLSPPSTGGLSGSTRFDAVFDDWDTTYLGVKHPAKHSQTSLHSTNPPSVAQNSERGLLHKSTTASMRDQYDDFKHVCSSSTRFKQGMSNWLAVTIILLSIFSTFFSGAFLIIALRGPRYGRRVGTDGVLTISTAAFLTSLFAKMIELSFVTVFVAYLGQSLARKAFRREENPGVTLAEMSMRNWVVQPGNLFTHWQSVRYAAASWLGIIALIATIVAMLYTSAATALVQPQLKFSAWERRSLQGPVTASFANPMFIQERCKTPIQYDDLADAQGTCIQLEHASQAYHNYMQWIGQWHDFALSGNGTRDLRTRPPGWALLHDNTTVTAPWIALNHSQPRTKRGTNWFINNITMAMPHAGVVQAAVDPANGIMQPDELNGLGIYSIRASVPVPFVNVLCVMNLAKSDLKPIVYGLWERGDPKVDIDIWPEQIGYGDYDPYLGGTPFDDIFQWGLDYGSYNWPPIFPKVPIDYNTIINDTTGLAKWGRTSVYILGKGGPVDAVNTPTNDNYALCQLQVGQTPNCSTRYNASSNVGTLEAICNDPDDDMRYFKSMSNATTGMAGLSPDWPNIASMWIRSINLNSGILNSNASNARLWTELILTNASYNWATSDVEFSIALPSPAEALAVMAGCTLLQSAQDAPFVTFWNYSTTSLDEPQTQWFNASVRAQEYASGGQKGYQKAFFLVLVLVFLINVFVLIYWFVHREWYTDFSDPPNLFSFAINSPPSEKLAECTCGGGPQSGERFKYYWKLGQDGGHVYMESPEIVEMTDSPNLRKRRRTLSEAFESMSSPVAKAAERFKRRSNT